MKENDFTATEQHTTQTGKTTMTIATTEAATATTTAEPLTAVVMTCPEPELGTATEDDPVLGPGCYFSYSGFLRWSSVQSVCPDSEMIKLSDSL